MIIKASIFIDIDYNYYLYKYSIIENKKICASHNDIFYSRYLRVYNRQIFNQKIYFEGNRILIRETWYVNLEHVNLGYVNSIRNQIEDLISPCIRAIKLKKLLE